MFATDFMFNGQRASDFGLMICSFDGNENSVSGGEMEYVTVKTPGHDKLTFYGSQLNSVLEWSFSICKNPCENKEPFFDRYEESRICKWLIRTDGYKPFHFDQPEYEDIHYNVYINTAPHQIGGKTAGFNLTVISDCAYGFTEQIRKTAIIDSLNPMMIDIHSDINAYILPTVKITGRWMYQEGSAFMSDFYISNENDTAQNASTGKATTFNKIEGESWGIEMDSDSDNVFLIGNDPSGIKRNINPDTFNWQFLRLIDGTNIITTNSNEPLKIVIEYREPRMIKV